MSVFLFHRNKNTDSISCQMNIMNNKDKPDTQSERSKNLRHDIMLAIKANNIPVSGEIWISLIFRTESELVKIAKELHINTA